MKKNIRLLIIIFLLLITNSSFSVNGRVTDKLGNPIPTAKIVFSNAKDSTKVYETYSDANGYYTLDLPTYSFESDKQYTFFDVYPNPFYNKINIPFYLNKSGNCYIFIYNLMGQKVKTILDRYTSAGLHQMVWDGSTDINQRIAPGFYFVYMYFEGRTTTQKIIMRTSHDANVLPNGVPSFSQIDTSKIINYNIKITSVETLPFSLGNFTITDINNTNFVLFKKLAIPFRVSGKYLSVNNGDNTYDTIFVNGINLGVGLPGKYPGEMAATAEDYRRWFIEMGEIGFNAIRTYTLHYPRFYDELAKYNQAHYDKPLYLLQGVWLDEEKPAGDFYSFSNEYDSDTREVIDCMHGNKVIPARPGRASGTYTTNISQWVLGFIMAREIHPYEVKKTNEINWNKTAYSGATMSMPSISQPTECWLTERMDRLILYERQQYQTERPVSFSSWPTLDPLFHITEHENSSPDYISEEDNESLDFEKLELIDAPAGFFVSYHAYPYYPDFITDDPGYLYGNDNYGPNSYVTYLAELHGHYYKYPLIIAEYGVPSSWGNAHYANSGMNHGGHDYESQGFSDARLLQNIHDNKLAGGCLFSWIDEWFKQTWITNRITCAPDRRLMWHNLASPEDNFGLNTFVADTVVYNNYQGYKLGMDLDNVTVAHDFQFFYLNVNLKDSMKIDDVLWVAFDTFKDTLGEFIMPNGQTLSNLSEFALKITSDSANLFVTRAYNTNGIYFYWWKIDTLTDQLYHSIKSTGKPWDLVTWKNGYKDTAIQYIGRLRSCDSLQVPTSLNAVVRNKYSYNIRIPWQLLNFTDPSQVKVLNDERLTPEVETEFSDGIAVTIFYRNSIYDSEKYYWDWWGYTNQNTGEFVFPKYKEVPKKSLSIFKDRLQNMNLEPLPQ